MATAPDPGAAPRPRRRPGRWRRWGVRPLAWGLALIAILLLGLQVFLASERARQGLRDLLTVQLRERLDRPVEIRDAGFALLPGTLWLEGLVIGGPTPEEPPFLAVERAVVDIDLFALRQRVVRLDLLRLESPTLRLGFSPTGDSNLPTFDGNAGDGDGQGTLDLRIDRVEVEDGVFFFDEQSLDLSLAAEALRVRLRGLGGSKLVGRITSPALSLQLPAAQPHTMAVSGAVTVEPGRLTVRQARATSPRLESQVEGGCDFRRDRKGREPACRFEASGQAEGALLADLGYFETLSGAVRFAGNLAWEGGATGWRSTFEAPRLEVLGRSLRAAAGRVDADRHGIRIDVDTAAWAGGTLDGLITVKPGASTPAEVDLALRGLVLDRLLAAQRIPLQGLDARVDAQVHYRVPRRHPQRGNGAVQVALTPGANDDGLPVAGNFPLRIEEGVVLGESIQLHNSTQSVLAQGRYDLVAQEGHFDFELITADIGALTPLLPLTAAASGAMPPRWLPRRGEGQVTGTLVLGAAGTRTSLRLRLNEAATPVIAVRQVRGTLDVEPQGIENLELELDDGKGALWLRGRIPFDIATSGTDTASDTDTATLSEDFALTLDAVEWPLVTAQPWLPIALPIDGPVTGRLELSTEAGSLGGRLQAEATSVTAYDTRLDSVTTTLEWDAEAIRVERLTVATAAGTVIAGGTVERPTGALDLHFAGPGLRLGGEPLRSLLAGTPVDGVVSAAARLRGTVDNPNLTLRLETAALTAAGRTLGTTPSHLDLTWAQGQLTAQGTVLDIELGGGGALSRQHAELDFKLAADHLHSVARLVPASLPTDFDGTLQGNLALSGPLGDGRWPAANLILNALRFTIEGRTVHNLEPLQLRFGTRSTTIETLYLGAEEGASELFLTGTVGYDGALDLRLQSQLAAGWLDRLIPNDTVPDDTVPDDRVMLDGEVNLLGRLGGTFEAPFFDGQGELSNGRLRLANDFPHTLEALSAVALFDPSSIVIDHARAAMAGGQVEATGRLALPLGTVEDAYRFQLAGRGLNLRYPEGWLLRGDVDLSLAPDASASAAESTAEEGQPSLLVNGGARLTEIQYRADLPVGFTQILRGFFERSRLEVEETNPLLAAVALNVSIAAPDALRVRNDLAELSGSADLVLRGSLARPILFGEVDIDDRSQLVLSGTTYQVERGHLTFANPTRIDPEVDLVATTRVKEYDIRLALSGTLDRLDTRFASEPPLPDLEVLSLVASGSEETVASRVVRGLADSNEPQGASAASFLYGQAASAIGDRVGALFGFDKFRIDPLLDRGDAISAARITVGKRLSKDIFVTYSADPSSTEDQRLQVEWQLSDSLVLVLTQNGDSTYAADARWETSF